MLKRDKYLFKNNSKINGNLEIFIRGLAKNDKILANDCVGLILEF